jgi:hypothetical protein
MTLISGPIAPERNPDIKPQYFQPSRFAIAAINRDTSTTVTMSPTTIDDVTTYPNYVVGQLVRFSIPFPYGIAQINEQTGYVTSVPNSLQVVVNINSSTYDRFIASPTVNNQTPQIIAIGDVNTGPINTGLTGQITSIQGSFINISPSAGGTS